MQPPQYDAARWGLGQSEAGPVGGCGRHPATRTARGRRIFTILTGIHFDPRMCPAAQPGHFGFRVDPRHLLDTVRPVDTYQIYDGPDVNGTVGTTGYPTGWNIRARWAGVACDANTSSLARAGKSAVTNRLCRSATAALSGC